MAHFAELDADNWVIDCVVVANSDCIDPVTGLESEATGIAFLNRVLPERGRWVQCSYNGTFRGRYPASPGFKYDEGLDEFVFISPEVAP